MRFLKWTALIVIVVAVIATVLHLRRDSIARGIANSMLSEQDARVIDLSVDTLATDRLELAELVIESENGTRYTVLGLSLPVSVGAAPTEQFSANDLIVTYERTKDEPTMLSAALHTALELPLSRPGLKATVGRVALPNLPELVNVSWTTSDTGQDLSFMLDAISVAVRAVRHDEPGHTITISASREDGEQVLHAEIGLTQKNGNYTAAGSAMIRPGAWLPVIRPLGLLPAGLERLEAQLEGPIEIRFDEGETGSAVFNARFELLDELATTYRSAGGSVTAMAVTAIDELAMVLDYPSFGWVAQAGAMDARLTTDSLDEVPVSLADLECRSGIRCTMQAAIDAQELRWNGYEFAAARLTLPIEVALDEVTRIDISSAATGDFAGVRTAGRSAESVSVVSFSGTQIIVGDDAWRCRIDALELSVKGFADGELVASFPLTFNDLDIRDSGQTVDTRLSVPPIADAAWQEMAILPPGAEGTVSVNDDRFNAVLQLADGSGAISAGIELMMDLATDAGSLVVSDALVSFDHASLSDLLPGWPYPLDVVGGRWAVEADVDWRTTGDDTRYGGNVVNEFDALAGKYNDIAFVGLGTNVSATLDPDKGVDMAPSSLAIRLVDVGLPLENIFARYTVDLRDKTLQVESLSAAALGGTFVADPFQYVRSAKTNVIPLRAQSIQLQLMVDLLGSEDIEMTGAISGELPVTMSGDDITIENGKLQSEPPGGVIRYQGDDGVLDAAAPDGSLSIVTRALSNFEFDSLTSDVDYTEAGDLKLQMRLSGVNPDMDATQPIIVNLGVENNMPQLLRSLQAIRSIEDILQRQTTNQAP